MRYLNASAIVAIIVWLFFTLCDDAVPGAVMTYHNVLQASFFTKLAFVAYLGFAAYGAVYIVASYMTTPRYSD